MSDNRNLYLALLISSIVVGGIWLALAFSGGPSADLAKVKPQGERIEVDGWFKVLAQRVPMELCSLPSYLKDCFQVEPTVCQIELSVTIRRCFEDKRAGMPRSLRGSRDAAYWGNQLIECGLKELETKYIKDRQNSQYCRSLNAWVNERPNGRLTKAQFVFTLEYELPKRLCDLGDKFFRRCFELDEEQCYDEASQAVNNCLEKYDSEIQGEVRVPVDSLPFTNTITKCTMQILTSKFSSQKRPDCQDSNLLENENNPN